MLNSSDRMAKESRNISIDIPKVTLAGILNLVENPRGLVVFAHGAGSSRLSPRNTLVANYLNDRGFATLLFDLLTEKEDQIYENRFDINLITTRLIETTKWLGNYEETKKLKLGYFGASTGAAAALKASINFFEQVKAIVSRGGRPDLALADLGKVQAPTLLIVGSLDDVVISLNEQAYQSLSGTKKMVIIPGATHLFEEPGKLEMVMEAGTKWFQEHLK